MGLIVQKFGGTSLGSPSRILHAAEIVTKARQSGLSVVVVVSAMAGETDRLIQLTSAVNANKNPREYDQVVSSGERISAGLFAMALESHGVNACSLSGAAAGVHTTGLHRFAAITEIDVQKLQSYIADDIVPVVTGFQGVNDCGDITTIGRGGSDISAVAIAAALHADECQIYTDVEGVYTSDPRIVPTAKRLDFITYREMLALSELGAKVLHRQAVEFAKRYALPVRVLSTFKPGPGTIISPKRKQVEPWVSGVAFDGNQAKISIIDIPMRFAESEEMKKLIDSVPFAIDMQLVNHALEKTHVDLSFTVHKLDYESAVAFSESLAKVAKAREVKINDQVAKLSLVGLGMRSHASVASRILDAFSDRGIGVHLISSTECKVSTLIDLQNMTVGANVLHQAFKLSESV